ncbi:hypothetical protein [Nocardia vermiculata]|uniref:Uncharacterized protein n=1 Tax=Nocardia vermiculata TaxID=257274 RepID=A0A846XXI7_9NOCA|nr:hypothetical protein [Nocardia vermiculata]NKY48919.1 hypothetical protein [Nocardia vermiculata]
MDRPSGPIFDIAHGDVGISRHLKNSLSIIRAATKDPDVRRQIDDVLAGRASLRSFGTSETFAQIFDKVPEGQVDRVVDMSDDERRRLAEDGELLFDRLRKDPDNRADDGTYSATLQEQSQGAGPETATPGSGTVQRNANVVPGTRKPNREQIFIPDEPDEDDLYFQERRNRGWLE